MSSEDFDNKILANIAKVIGLFILAVILYSLGEMHGELNIIKNYKLECKDNICKWIIEGKTNE